ncbi:hypothetical protein FCP93_20820 [Salmonella enterica]|uniref:hypothetical protein n=1 Tax=Salmonella enterica TaxID=28901 RepID=UPI0008FD34C9|nr:hypothetical protein [Salmonella enterica]EBU8855785.1 hypothetical protein [Salmonella enterica subsp. enterica serovar Braenderup]EBV8138974.1 hypothetical protein [Salmonella enterica subsp. enterica serovar Thompson]ECI0974207.1 hypothetical protein [Salmonella enterica subsp. diarizonae]ECY0835286.1 hypothetical protein [Salmonella enterica subsp. enterica]EDQ7360868.1 hypothetical protein [Salmonella enterica subsp. enterica serovar Carrau]EDS6648280.1 hypothetical protein [Salmonell
MLFTKWRFLFNIVSNSRNPSFVKVDLKEGPAAMRGFLRFKHDLSESVLSPITRTHPDTLAHSWRRDRTLPKKKTSAMAGFVKAGGKRLR